MSSRQFQPSTIPERIEAIRRVPGYQKDFREWARLAEHVAQAHKKAIADDLRQREQQRLEQACAHAIEALNACEERLRKHWGLRPPFPPPPETSLEAWDRLRWVNPCLAAVEVVPPSAAAKQGLIEKVLDGYNPIRLEYVYESLYCPKCDGGRTRRNKKAGSLKPTSDGKFRCAKCGFSRRKEQRITYRAGKHLCLIVDLSRTETGLLRELRGYLKFYQAMLPRNESRKKPTAVVDIWWVYDQFKNGKGKSIKEITTQLLLSKRVHDTMVAHPYGATYNAVERAIEKANGLIASASLQ